MRAGWALEPLMLELPGRWLCRDLLWVQSCAHPTLSHTGTGTVGHSHVLCSVNARPVDAWDTSQTRQESQLCNRRKRSARHILIISQITLVSFVLIMIPFIFMMRKECRLVILLRNKIIQSSSLRLRDLFHATGNSSTRTSGAVRKLLTIYNYWLELIRLFLVLCHPHTKCK